MKKIFLLTDYKDRFGSKYNDLPYRSGFDKNLLAEHFKNHGFQAIYRSFTDVDFRSDEFSGEYVLYTSSEDDGYNYKSFIEDIVLGLELSGAKVIPAYKYLRANNNKVFMEILRDQFYNDDVKALKAKGFGTLEDYIQRNERFNDEKYVVKMSEGASGTGVFLADKNKDIYRVIKRASRTKNLISETWEEGRALKHKGYIKESKYRKKYIIQDFIQDLQNDWKIYIFGNKTYIFYRPIFKNRGIRASGGGYENYLYGLKSNPPLGIFDFSDAIFRELNVPHASLDIAHNGKDFFLLEFQCLYFGTAGITLSNEYFTKHNNMWIQIDNSPYSSDQEKVYVESIVQYIHA
ncbi:MAG: hypothetical protein AB9834_16375 [Lentimicrobium sp.]